MTRASSGPADDARLPLRARERLKAVVFDANAYGKARPDLRHLKRLAGRLAAIGIETWVPEPVSWEWAEHVARDWQAVKNAARQERDGMKRAGLKVDVPTVHYSSRDTVIDTVLTNLNAIPHVKIIPLSGDSATAGLKDQVLQQEPAKLKGDVKTGASDSAWLRDVLARVSPEEIVVVSSDGDVKRAFRAWRKPVPLILKREKLRQTLFDVTVDDGHAQSSIVRYLLDRLPVGNLDGGGEGAAFDIGPILGLESAISRETDGDGTSSSVYGASVTRLVALAGLYDVSVEHGVPDDAQDTLEPEESPGHTRPDELGSAQHDVAYATAFFLAEGEATIQTLLHDGDPEVSAIHYDNILVRAQLSFRFTDGAITAVAAEADATALLAQGAYDDDDDALSALAEALTCVPGLDLDTDFSSSDLSAKIRGVQAQVSVEMKRDGGDWTLSVALWHSNSSGGDLDLDGEVEVMCSYDPDSWWGGSRDGFQGPDAYQVSVYATDLPGNHGVWSVPAWVIDRIDWSTFDSDETA
ncbi:hypothetical protein SSPO_001480 [Streptomyces antimycoticus]|uniref:Uncharacterized protein n=1 Tax=Streptomyces antimycoticus TaxID=68175 RepID=A0A499UCM9_9ACTN|nr:hypothetical protein [Streptomyces antimycoticus]BBJ37430.1 hypothetical protein SSPO_001480 [Streptomyces antimycoticus]